jgi:uncharacterized damage-inducible protein DinB
VSGGIAIAIAIAELHLEEYAAMLNHVTYLYGFNLRFADRLVKDLSTEQMAAQPGGVINHPAWTLGHLAVSADYLGELLGLESDVPEGWSELFKTGGEPSGDASIYPAKEEMLRVLEEKHAKNAVAIQNIDAALLSEPHPNEKTRNYFPTRGDQIVFMMTSHEMDHLGQIAAWRRAMGLGSATGV